MDTIRSYSTMNCLMGPVGSLNAMSDLPLMPRAQYDPVKENLEWLGTTKPLYQIQSFGAQQVS